MVGICGICNKFVCMCPNVCQLHYNKGLYSPARSRCYHSEFFSGFVFLNKCFTIQVKCSVSKPVI